MKLEDLREDIDRIDTKLIELFERRMEVVSKVADYKKSVGMPVFDPERERLKLADISQRLENKELDQYLQKFFQNLFDLSKDYQEVRNG